ncbi:MAG: lysophospholipase [Acetatifactor muris]|nr:lysophospholipase [Acetatifactor muris]
MGGILMFLVAFFTLAGCGISESEVPDKNQMGQQSMRTENKSAMPNEHGNLEVYEYRQQEITVLNNEQKIYGIAYIPETGEQKIPLVICAHGLGADYASCLDYAEEFATHGLAVYCFDFRGGGGIRSDGDTTEMSVMTEVSDLESILAAAEEWEFVDTGRIVLFGESQGGIASAIAAARHTERVAGLILEYPAFLVSDSVRELYDSPEEVPESFFFNWITVGRPYVVDMWDYDVYGEIGNFEKKVLLMHGSADRIVPISYSDRAAEVYENADYYVIDGAGHGFWGAAYHQSLTYIYGYLQEIGVI